MENREWLKRSDYNSLWEDGAPPARSCGPKPDWFGEDRFNHLVAIYQSIKKNGYQINSENHKPLQDQHMKGTLLVRDEEERILVADGQHRAASLSALNYSKVPMVFYVINKRGPGIIRRDDAVFWPLVRKNIFSKNQAISIFDRIFEADPPLEINTLEKDCED